MDRARLALVGLRPVDPEAQAPVVLVQLAQVVLAAQARVPRALAVKTPAVHPLPTVEAQTARQAPTTTPQAVATPQLAPAVMPELVRQQEQLLVESREVASMLR